MWTDCTFGGKREVEAWWVWNVALEEKKIVWVFYVGLEKTSLKDLCSRDSQYGGYFNKQRIKKKTQIEQELKQNWIEKKMYWQFIREMPDMLTRIKLGNGYPNVIWRTIVICSTGTGHHDKLGNALHRYDQWKPSMKIILCRKNLKACNSWYVDVKNWLRKNMRDDMTK